jgi:leucine-rich repeat protein SHOC2
MAVLYPNPVPVKMDWNRALRDLPEFGENLSALEHLEVNNCYLSTLPETINTMKSLATLNCQSNQLESLPSDLVLPALDLFNCSSNPKLPALPATLGQCASLRVCFFNGTAVAAFPEGFGALAKLERVMVPKDAGMEGAPDYSQASATAGGNKGWIKAV